MKKSAKKADDGNRCVTLVVVHLRSATAEPKISATWSSVPHRGGGWTPGGGATYAETVFSIPPTNPVGVQLAAPITPPGVHTRIISAAVREWSGANMLPMAETT